MPYTNKSFPLIYAIRDQQFMYTRSRLATRRWIQYANKLELFLDRKSDITELKLFSIYRAYSSWSEYLRRVHKGSANH